MHTQGVVRHIPNRPPEPTPHEVHDDEADRHVFDEEDPDIEDQVYDLHRELYHLDNDWFNV